MTSDHASPDADEQQRALDQLQDWVRDQLGISFAREQRELYADRIHVLCRDLSITPAQLLRQVLEGDSQRMKSVAEVVSTNYTFFFREPESFEFVAKHVLPALPDEPLRIWSAAASSGDEAYSLAILAREHFGPAALARVRILGTDVSERQLALAERAEYAREQLGPTNDLRLARWFTPAARGGVRVLPEISELCTFRRLNLAQLDWPFERCFHVIFLRNVLFYFEPEVRRTILERCYDFAEPGAYLITSLTEPMIDVRTRWTVLRHAIFRKGPA